MLVARLAASAKMASPGLSHRVGSAMWTQSRLLPQPSTVSTLSPSSISVVDASSMVTVLRCVRSSLEERSGSSGGSPRVV